MPRASTRIKVNIRVESDDLDAIKHFYPVLGYNEVIRNLVSKHVIQLRKRERELAHDHGNPQPNNGSESGLDLSAFRARPADPDNG